MKVRLFRWVSLLFLTGTLGLWGFGSAFGESPRRKPLGYALLSEHYQASINGLDTRLDLGVGGWLNKTETWMLGAVGHVSLDTSSYAYGGGLRLGGGFGKRPGGRKFVLAQAYGLFSQIRARKISGVTFNRAVAGMRLDWNRWFGVVNGYLNIGSPKLFLDSGQQVEILSNGQVLGNFRSYAIGPETADLRLGYRPGRVDLWGGVVAMPTGTALEFGAGYWVSMPVGLAMGNLFLEGFVDKKGAASITIGVAIGAKSKRRNFGDARDIFFHPVPVRQAVFSTGPSKLPVPEDLLWKRYFAGDRDTLEKLLQDGKPKIIFVTTDMERLPSLVIPKNVTVCSTQACIFRLKDGRVLSLGNTKKPERRLGFMGDGFMLGGSYSSLSGLTLWSKRPGSVLLGLSANVDLSDYGNSGFINHWIGNLVFENGVVSFDSDRRGDFYHVRGPMRWTISRNMEVTPRGWQGVGAQSAPIAALWFIGGTGTGRQQVVGETGFSMEVNQSRSVSLRAGLLALGGEGQAVSDGPFFDGVELWNVQASCIVCYGSTHVGAKLWIGSLKVRGDISGSILLVGAWTALKNETPVKKVMTGGVTFGDIAVDGSVGHVLKLRTVGSVFSGYVHMGNVQVGKSVDSVLDLGGLLGAGSFLKGRNQKLKNGDIRLGNINVAGNMRQLLRMDGGDVQVRDSVIRLGDVHIGGNVLGTLLEFFGTGQFYQKTNIFLGSVDVVGGVWSLLAMRLQTEGQLSWEEGLISLGNIHMASIGSDGLWMENLRTTGQLHIGDVVVGNPDTSSGSVGGDFIHVGKSVAMEPGSAWSFGKLTFYGPLKNGHGFIFSASGTHLSKPGDVPPATSTFAGSLSFGDIILKAGGGFRLEWLRSSAHITFGNMVITGMAQSLLYMNALSDNGTRIVQRAKAKTIFHGCAENCIFTNDNIRGTPKTGDEEELTVFRDMEIGEGTYNKTVVRMNSNMEFGVISYMTQHSTHVPGLVQITGKNIDEHGGGNAFPFTVKIKGIEISSAASFDHSVLAIGDNSVAKPVTADVDVGYIHAAHDLRVGGSGTVFYYNNSYHVSLRPEGKMRLHVGRIQVEGIYDGRNLFLSDVNGGLGRVDIDDISIGTWDVTGHPTRNHLFSIGKWSQLGRESSIVSIGKIAIQHFAPDTFEGKNSDNWIFVSYSNTWTIYGFSPRLEVHFGRKDMLQQGPPVIDVPGATTEWLKTHFFWQESYTPISYPSVKFFGPSGKKDSIMRTKDGSVSFSAFKRALLAGTGSRVHEICYNDVC